MDLSSFGGGGGSGGGGPGPSSSATASNTFGSESSGINPSLLAVLAVALVVVFGLVLALKR
jgi:hypothetical protein